MPVALGSQKSVESPGTGIRNMYEPLWRLGINLEFSKIISVLNCWAVSSALNGVFKLKFIYENSSIYYQAWLKDLSYWVMNSERLVLTSGVFIIAWSYVCSCLKGSQAFRKSSWNWMWLCQFTVAMPWCLTGLNDAPAPIVAGIWILTWSPIGDAVFRTLNLGEECHWRQTLGV